MRGAGRLVHDQIPHLILRHVRPVETEHREIRCDEFERDGAGIPGVSRGQIAEPVVKLARDAEVSSTLTARFGRPAPNACRAALAALTGWGGSLRV